MPLTTDSQTNALAHDFIKTLQGMSGSHPGQRPAHAKGLLVTGTFTPSSAASTLSTAPHFAASSTPVSARFSNFTGLPDIPDNDGNANPRGLALRFHIGGNETRKHTDIVAHSANGFPAKDGPEFLAFLQSLTKNPDAEDGVKAFLGSHPAALAFVQLPKPVMSSFARQAFYAVSAQKFTDSKGTEKTFRYRIVPAAGEDPLTEDEVAKKDKNFLMDEMQERLEKGEATVFKLIAQMAQEGDVEDNATIVWPESRELVELGEIKLTKVAENNADEQKHIIFDPVPRVAGIKESKDPLFNVRADAYLISGKERRSAVIQKD